MTDRGIFVFDVLMVSKINGCVQRAIIVSLLSFCVGFDVSYGGTGTTYYGIQHCYHTVIVKRLMLQCQEDMDTGKVGRGEKISM